MGLRGARFRQGVVPGSRGKDCDAPPSVYSIRVCTPAQSHHPKDLWFDQAYIKSLKAQQQ
jgi:hypothetical protein